MFTTRISLYRLVLNIGYAATLKFVCKSIKRLQAEGCDDLASEMMYSWLDVRKLCDKHGMT